MLPFIFCLLWAMFEVFLHVRLYMLQRSLLMIIHESHHITPLEPFCHSLICSSVPSPGRGFLNARVAPTTITQPSIFFFLPSLYLVSHRPLNTSSLPPPMLCNQTARLTTKPDMGSCLAILEPMLIDNGFDLAGSTAVGAQRGEIICPAVEENRCV